jgi:HTH-type transcriptional regulator/antitoxin MqsA
VKYRELDDALARAKQARRLPPPAARVALRKGAGLVQDDVARSLHVTRATVSRWESGERTPRGESLHRYIEILDRLAREALSA